MIDLAQNKGKARIAGSSLFFVCARDYYYETKNSSVKIASVYLIDLCHMEVFENEEERDMGFIHGMKGVIAMLKEIDRERD